MLEAAPQHSAAFRFRRVLNWFPLGLTYAFMYMGRYNLTVAKNALGDLMTKTDFGWIFGIGAVVYGLSVLINGPLTDRIGGRKSMLIGAAGSLVMNALMGLVLYGAVNFGWNFPITITFSVLYALNMYFQSFGAVAIVTTKAPWFHVRERGSFSTIFGVMISTGVFFAFDVGKAIVGATRAGVEGRTVDENWWVFFAPSVLLAAMWVVLFFFLRNTPKDAGYADFSTGEGSLSDDGERLPVTAIAGKILSHPVLLVICGIAIANGVMKNGIMNWFPIYSKETGISESSWISANWGLVMMFAGIGGSILTGWASDRFFGSRRAPMTAILYGGMSIAAVVMCLTVTSSPWFIAGCATFCAAGIIGVQGIVSGTTTVDFGGKKNSGAAVGFIDGLVYVGTAMQNFVAPYLLPQGAEQKDPANWLSWPALLIPAAVMGTILAIKIWNALPSSKKKADAVPPASVAGSQEAAA